MNKKNIILILLIIGLDQFTKYLITTFLDIGERIPVISNWMNITYVQNRGVAFSMFSGNWIVTIILTSLLLIACLVIINKEKENPVLIFFISCIFAGGASNLIDRVFRSYVVDMISCGSFAVFNIADIFVTCGCVLCIIYLLLSFKDEKEV